MKATLLTVMIGITLLLIMASCSDDDCATCSQAPVGSATFASMIYDGSVRCYGRIIGSDGRIIDVDSVTCDGYPLYVRAYAGEGLETYCSVPDGTEIPGNSGDTIEVVIYTPGGVTRGSTVLLDDDSDQPQVYDWLLGYPYDTVPKSSEVTVNWSLVPKADFYVVEWYYEFDHNGTYDQSRNIVSTTDSSLVIPASQLAYDGRMYCYIYAVTGPGIYSPGNLTGGQISGRHNSMVYSDVTIYVGTGNAYPAGVRQAEEDLIPIRDPFDFLF